MIYVWSRASESRNYMIDGNKHNFPGLGFRYGLYSGVKHKVVAGSNEWCDAVATAWNNGGGGYQYEDPTGIRVRIFGSGAPGSGSMPRVIRTGDKYDDMQAVNGDRYRYNGVAWAVVDRDSVSAIHNAVISGGTF